jgi:hypothetical protein
MPSRPSAPTEHEEIAKLDLEVAEQNDEISNLNQKIKTLLGWVSSFPTVHTLVHRLVDTPELESKSGG